MSATPGRSGRALNHATESLFSAVRILFDLQCPLISIDVSAVLVDASSVPTSIVESAQLYPVGNCRGFRNPDRSEKTKSAGCQFFRSSDTMGEVGGFAYGLFLLSLVAPGLPAFRVQHSACSSFRLPPLTRLVNARIGLRYGGQMALASA